MAYTLRRYRSKLRKLTILLLLTVAVIYYYYLLAPFIFKIDKTGTERTNVTRATDKHARNPDVLDDKGVLNGAESRGNTALNDDQRQAKHGQQIQPQMRQDGDLSREEVKASKLNDVDNESDDGLAVVENLPQIVIDRNAPGENGRGINIQADQLNPEERRRFDDGWKKNQYNQYASDMISLHRSLPDVRDKRCKSVKYQQNLPDTSVVICFNNEAWSALLRTVHSVLDRTPQHLLREIILVDDFSDMPHLHRALDEYVALLPKVRLFRTNQRQGLIRARMEGFSLAKAPVVTFLDSHCECAGGWLEPLLDRIAHNETNVVCPVIDAIDDVTFQFRFQRAEATNVGGFTWDLLFQWHAIPDSQRQRRTSAIEPVRTPTMAGGLFAISKRYFEKLGKFDPGMDIWGGENLELSFKVWMCGGSLEIVPCSHVGHIFRRKSPYTGRYAGRTGIDVVKVNSIRLAEVWLDDYKQYYYERINYDLGNYGDVTERKELREKLKCKSFAWYIHNVYPELFIPDDVLESGEIRTQIIPIAMCVDSPTDPLNYDLPIKLWPCNGNAGKQSWVLSNEGQIRRDDACILYSSGGDVSLNDCNTHNQTWKYQLDGTIHHANTGLCLEASLSDRRLLMSMCTGSDRQIWTWSRKNHT